jgi:Ca2+-binding RTX toxin-like protein
MHQLKRLKETPNPLWLGATAAAVAALAAGVIAGQGNAAISGKSGGASPEAARHTSKNPTLKNGVLTVNGTDADDQIALRLAAGQPDTIQVDFGDDGTPDFSFARAQITAIVVDARGGDDTVRIDESNGVFTDTIPTTFDGGSGNDTLIDGSGAGTLHGGSGDDTLTGGSGAETLDGGSGNDTIIGNRGNDVALMGGGDDTFVWNPGDGSDTVEGQAGTDTMQFNGSNANENIDLSANGNRLRLFRDVGNIVMDTDGVEQVNLETLGGVDTVTVNDLTKTDVNKVNVDLASPPGSGVGDGQADNVIVNGTNGKDTVTITGSNGAATVSGLATTVNLTGAEPANDTLAVNTLGGKDTIDASGLAASAIKLAVDSGAGNDTIAGSQGADVLVGGDGNDTIDGNQGNDVAFLGAGNDTLTWDPGDGSDTVEGQDGTDTMVFNGSNANENIDLSANGSRLRLTRDVGNVVMDVNGVEQVNVNALGGTDTVMSNDLTGTGVGTVNVDLAASGGGGDGQADDVIVNGTAGPDSIKVSGSNGAASVTGLAAAVNVANSEPANDTFTINALAGADSVDASALDSVSTVKLEENGGDDADVLTGSPGSDLVNGGRGNDVAFLGSGDDTFVWNPGDGSDTVEGQAGTDTMLFNGSNANENIDLSANGSRLRLFRDVGNVTMDTNGVETVDVNALGGADTVTVNDLTGTGVSAVNDDLAAPPGSGAGDGQADNVIVNGTDTNDTVTIAGANGAATVTGLAATVNVVGAEPANDRLTVNALDGDDSVSASGLAANAIGLTIDGGTGADVLIGGDGNDTLLGGSGDDVLIGGPGQDTLDGGPGNNVLIQ